MKDTTRHSGAAPAKAAGAVRPAQMHHWMMWACCLAMLAGAGFIVYSAPPGQALSETLLLGLPLFGCLAMHFALHRLMGRSCHGGSDTKEESR
ncbi:hypothetical protein [Lutibaculum baratangense]|uniref:DUF2933 domain-containing protein n=1 Tax=Lutibaculum baratangense AMV1 TaxID=631454 RepID=V4RF40_9HYPH|nr:hypothetical protein [Lutibaculum baratangense]ESR23984.1 hypothetical protein N177_2753 [Lutibaculum baratangense AMV1]